MANDGFSPPVATACTAGSLLADIIDTNRSTRGREIRVVKVSRGFTRVSSIPRNAGSPGLWCDVTFEE